MLKTTQTSDERIEGELNKWKDILCSWTGRQNTLKITIFPKLF